MHCVQCQTILYPYDQLFQTQKEVYFLCEYCFKKHPILTEFSHVVLEYTDLYIMHIILEDQLSNLAAMHYLSFVSMHQNNIVLWLEETELNTIIDYEDIQIGEIYIYHVEKNKKRWYV
jgi:hypothetical protein